MWEASGGPPLSGGIYVGIFRTHQGDPPTGDTCSGASCGDVATGVTFTKSGVAQPNDDYYFMAAETTHQTIDPDATATGANGTGLLTNASVEDNLVYSGTGGLSDMDNCQWKTHAAASLPGIVFVQIYRPTNIIGKTCSL
jgi:hypothetical protein